MCFACVSRGIFLLFSLEETNTVLSLLSSLAWYMDHGFVPTYSSMKGVYIVPEEDDPHYEDNKNLLVWYLDKYLPACVGTDSYGPAMRYHHRLTKKMDINGKNRCLVSAKLEAYGLFLLDNCHNKWTNIFKKEKETPGWKAPKSYLKNDDTTHPYHICKWSDATAGQGKGWKKGTFKFISECNDHVTKQRTDDSKNKNNKWMLHSRALKILREENNVEAKELQASNKRQRTHGEESSEEDFEDKEEDLSEHYSSESEDSSGE